MVKSGKEAMSPVSGVVRSSGADRGDAEEDDEFVRDDRFGSCIVRGGGLGLRTVRIVVGNVF